MNELTSPFSRDIPISGARLSPVRFNFNTSDGGWAASSYLYLADARARLNAILPQTSDEATTLDGIKEIVEDAMGRLDTHYQILTHPA